jgi:hypothetical protein
MEIKFIIVKLLDLAYIAIIYCFLAVILSVITKKIANYFPEQYNYDKSILTVVFEIIAYVWYISVIVYIVRNTVERIPSPFNNMFGFSHVKMKELHSAGMFSIIFIHLQEGFIDKLKYLRDMTTDI